MLFYHAKHLLGSTLWYQRRNQAPVPGMLVYHAKTEA